MGWSMVVAKVIFDYTATQDDEIDLKVGEIVKGIEKKDVGWWEGEVNGKRGMFPENFVEEIDAADGPTLPVAPTVPAVTANTKKLVRVTFDYQATQADELDMKVGDIIEILEDEDDGWWKGKIKNKEGMFPSNFVEVIKDVPTPALPEPLQPEATSPPADTGIKANRPKSGFGISPIDLSRDKLKKTGKTPDSASKPIHQPPEHHEPPKVEKKAQAPPIPSATPTMVTKEVQKARVTFDYDPDQEDELKMKVGEIILITDKNIFEGWMQGELNGKSGLFPDNFVELLPLETISVPAGGPTNNMENNRASVKREAKTLPDKTAEPHVSEKPKMKGPALFPPGGNGLKEELEKKLALGGGKPTPPGAAMKPNKFNKPPPPGPPAKPKPSTGAKPPAPANPLSPEFPRTGSVSRNEFKNPSRINSVSFPPKSTLPKPAAPTIPSATPKASDAGAFNKPKVEEPSTTTSSTNNNNNNDFDLDSVQHTDPLKHIQRAKPPTKQPPSKFKGFSGSPSEDQDVSESSGNSGADQKEVIELKKEVSELKNKMEEMEKKFKRLLTQLHDEVDKSQTERAQQKIVIDRLKRQVDLLHDDH